MLCCASVAAAAAPLPLPPSLAELADKYSNDKSPSHGHAYSNLYAMLLDPHRESVRNMTEVGVLNGQGTMMWADYFPNAHVYGLDIKLEPRAVSLCSGQPRIHLYEKNAHLRGVPQELGLAEESMDLVVEDASHSHTGTHLIAESFWPLVKPGGFYVIEDVNTGGDSRGKYEHSGTRPGFSSLVHNATGALREIYLNNEVFFADTMVGVDVSKNKFAKSQRLKHWMRDTVDHNWHLIVIRKKQQQGQQRHERRQQQHDRQQQQAWQRIR